MKRIIISFIFIAPFLNLFSQPTEGVLQPGQSFTNNSSQVLFYMPKPKVVKLLNYQTRTEIDSLRIIKYKELVGNMEMRVAASDSAITLRSLEAEYWKMQLEKNDRELEQVKIDKEALISENNKIRKSRIYYTLAGILATSIVYISLK
jgi:hypothetical protein